MTNLDWLSDIAYQPSYVVIALDIDIHYYCQYLADVLLRPLSASSHRPLRSLNRLELLVPHTRTSMAQSRSFTSIGPSLWNALSPSTRTRILSSNLSSTFAFLKTFFFSLALRTGSASEWFSL